MFDGKAIEDYKQVVAPPELKNRVMKSVQAGYAKSNNIRLYKSLSLVAACLVMVFAVAVFSGRGTGLTVTLNGTRVSQTPIVVDAGDTGVMAASFGRAMQPQISIPLTVEASDKSEIAVSEGEMQIFDATGTELLYTGTGYTAEGTVSLLWTVARSAGTEEAEAGDAAPYMTVTAKGDTRTLQLQYEETDGVWMIYQK